MQCKESISETKNNFMASHTCVKRSKFPKKLRGCNHISTQFTFGFSATILAQVRINLMASMLISGNEMLHANSDRHFTASWKLPTTASKCCAKTVSAIQWQTNILKRRLWWHLLYYSIFKFMFKKITGYNIIAHITRAVHVATDIDLQ